MSECTKQAENFAKKYGVKLTVIGEPEYRKYFHDDRNRRYVFKMRLQRGKKSHTFSFGQSINDGLNAPIMYDILACLTKYDPIDFENFCFEYGYDTYSRTAERTYKAVVKEWESVQRLFSDCLEGLREIY